MGIDDPVRHATKTLVGLARLAFLGLAGSLLFVALLLLGNVALCLLAHVADTLLDLINAIFTG